MAEKEHKEVRLVPATFKRSRPLSAHEREVIVEALASALVEQHYAEQGRQDIPGGVTGQLYVLGLGQDSHVVKVGYSKSPKLRLVDIRAQLRKTGIVDELTVLATMPGSLEAELQLHKRLRRKIAGGLLSHEWYRRDDSVDRLVAAMRAGATFSELLACCE